VAGLINQFLGILFPINFHFLFTFVCVYTYSAYVHVFSVLGTSLHYFTLEIDENNSHQLVITVTSFFLV